MLKTTQVIINAIVASLVVPLVLFALVGPAPCQEPSGDIAIDSNTGLEIDQSGSTEPSDSFQIETSFTNNDLSAEGACDGDDPVAQGLTLTLGSGTCANSTGVVSVQIPPFSGGEDARSSLTHHKHSPGKHKRHFTLKMPMKAVDPSTGETETATVDAEITVLPTTAGTCGQWKLDAEVSQVDLSALTANPVVVSIAQGDDSGCNDQIQAQFCNDNNQGNDNSQGDENCGDGGGDNNNNDQ